MPTPFEYDQLEDVVVARLQSTISSLANIIPLPESDDEIQQQAKASIGNNQALIMVAYGGSDFGPSMNTNQIVQEETISVLIQVVFNKLRGERGIYKQIRLIRKSLLGYKTTFGNRLSLKTVEFDERNSNTSLFSYNVTFTMAKPVIQADLDGEDSGTEANLVDLKYKRNGETVIHINTEPPQPET